MSDFEKFKNCETIDLTPTWTQIVDMGIHISRGSDNFNAISGILGEVKMLTSVVDDLNEKYGNEEAGAAMSFGHRFGFDDMVFVGIKGVRLMFPNCYHANLMIAKIQSVLDLHSEDSLASEMDDIETELNKHNVWLIPHKNHIEL
jgi:hypothetical protein